MMPHWRHIFCVFMVWVRRQGIQADACLGFFYNKSICFFVCLLGLGIFGGAPISKRRIMYIMYSLVCGGAVVAILYGCSIVCFVVL